MSNTGGRIVFPPFMLDLDAERLWRGDEAVDLRPKAWQLLHFFVERPGRLITKDELMDTVWADVTVTIASLNQTVVELRQALGDSARDPRFIETVHRRGYRFIADLEEGPDPGLRAADPSAVTHTDRPMIGRDGEIARLGDAFRDARSGRRQVVFVTGEPGIGKTSVLRAFIDGLSAGMDDGKIFLGGAQCLDLLGECEAYLPVLETLERLTREERGESLRRALKRFAPTWLVQMPWLMNEGDASAASLAGTPARLLREFCVVVEAMAAERPMVVWIEDLHWCDPATVDLIGALARRTEPARLLLIVTYRPVDAAIRDHPIADLKKSLVAEGLCREVALELLSQTEVETWVTDRFGSSDDAGVLARLIHDHTDGNPLFVETTLSYLASQGLVVEGQQGWELSEGLDEIGRRLPESLGSIVEAQLAGMADEEVRTLEAASAIGEAFDVQPVAAALEMDVDDCETICGRLARWGRFLEAEGSSSWPDGSVGGRYRFQHDVFRQILYRRTLPSRRQRVHRNVALCIETGFDWHRPRVAAELAVHFERGGEPDRAVDCFAAAADGVVRRFADREAVTYLDHALRLLGARPASPDRNRRECDLRRRLGRALVHSVSYTAAEQTANTDRLIELGAAVGDAEAQLVGLAYRLDMRLQSGDLDGVQALATQSLRLAGDENHPVFLGHAYQDLGMEAGLRGEHSRSAEMCTRSIEFLQGIPPREIAQVMDYDLAVFSIAFSSWAEWMLGRPDGARRHIEVAQERAAHEDTTPFGIAIVLSTALTIEFFRRDRKAAHEVLRDLEAHLEEYGLPVAFAQTAAAAGWLRTADGDADEGIEYMTAAAEDLRSAGMVQGLSVLYATIAEAESARGRPAAGFEALDEAMQLVEGNEERFWEAEIHRLRGELLRLDGDDESAEASFRKSLGVANGQDALSLELRTATSLARLLADTGRTDEARDLLEGVMGRFTEGLDTADYLDAKGFLEAL